MGIKNLNFVDNNPPQCDAEWLNSVKSEINNLVNNTSQSATTSDLAQLQKGVAMYAGNGDFYTDGGIADAYVLAVVGGKQAPVSYEDGMRIRFVVGNTNTGPSTVNVSGIAAKNIEKNGGGTPLAAGDLTLGDLVTMTYRSAQDIFVYEPPASITNSAVARAWVNFNGTGTIAIRDDYNVLSLVDNGVGLYTYNLDITLNNTNGAALATAAGATVAQDRSAMSIITSTTTVDVGVNNATGNAVDVEYVYGCILSN